MIVNEKKEKRNKNSIIERNIKNAGIARNNSQLKMNKDVVRKS